MRVNIVTPRGFDPSIPNAAQTTRLGYLHGFEEIGAPATLVSVVDDTINPERDTLFWLTYNDYKHLSGRMKEVVSSHRHIVQVNTWFDGMEELHRAHGAPSPFLSPTSLKGMEETEPDFVWCSAPEAHFEFYEGWIKHGFRLVSLPWACDTTRYCPSPGGPFDDVQVAFVGGYRTYKEPQYDAYLWPYEPKVWGYSPWPRHYQGLLEMENEKFLYSQAMVSPSIGEPQFAITGDTVERPFKIMGCKGLCVLDVSPTYKHLFTSEEALMPGDMGEYHLMMGMALRYDGFNQERRERGYKAVMERHTYAHRARKILEEIGA